jgi:hypothetical protein
MLLLSRVVDNVLAAVLAVWSPIASVSAAYRTAVKKPLVTMTGSAAALVATGSQKSPRHATSRIIRFMLVALRP